MAIIGGILIFVSLGVFAVGVVTLIRPMRRLYIPNRRIAGAVLGASIVLLVAGGAMVPSSNENDAKTAADKVEAPATAKTKSTATPQPTSTRRPTDKPPATNTPSTPATPTATPLTLAAQMEKSIRDNKNATKSGGNLDRLSVQFDQEIGQLAVSIKPNSPNKLTPNPHQRLGVGDRGW
jgi:hypothetical protein